MTRKSILIIPLILFAAFSQAGCYLPPECDPESEDFDEEECETLADFLIGVFSYAAYGNITPPTPSLCPAGLICRPPFCTWLSEDGAFRRFNSNETKFESWHGDKVTNTATPCESSGARFSWALTFLATTPEGASASASSQVFQVIDLNSARPPGMPPTARRVRAQAGFRVILGEDPSLDRQFGLRVDAYTGDPAAFPQSGDPENLPTNNRLSSVEDIGIYPQGDSLWQRLYIETMIPEDADFLVVLLEAYENVVNDTTGFEFTTPAGIDGVQVVLDAGNLAPMPRPDAATTPAGEPVVIPVLRNDSDPDDPIDASTLTVVIEAEHGTAEVNGDGSITYTSELGFSGEDEFTYLIADPAGLTGSAPVTVTVAAVNRPPVAVADTAMTTPGTPIDIDVLANDSDPDGDPLSIIAFGQPSNGAVGVVVADNTMRYLPVPGFTGTDRFAYIIADDQGARSNEVEVVIIVQ